jgi:hypothetical protein
MPAEIDYEDWAEQVEHASLLTKSATATTRDLGRSQLDRLNRLALAGLVKVGPKGYEHGWIFVGPRPKGGRVFHPHHGSGTVTRSGKRTVGVQFDSGHHAAFEHGARGTHPNVAATGAGHFGERIRKPRAASKPVAGTPAATTAGPHDALSARLDQANRAISEGRHDEAVNHLTSAAALAPDKTIRDQITGHRNSLAARIMGVPDPAADRARYAKELVLRMAAGEKFDVNQEDVPHLMQALDGADPVNLALVQLTGNGNENLFQRHMRDIPRDQMPALPDNVEALKPFIDHLRSKGVKAELVQMDPRQIMATQSQLSGPKVAKMAGFMKSGWKPGGALIVSQENALLDGHHRWAGAAVASIQHRMGVPDTQPVMVTALRVDLPIDELLKVGEMYSGPKKSLSEAP